MNKVNIVLDATMIDTFMSCEAKFDMRFNKNKIPITKAKPLDRGALIHSGFESYFNGLKSNLSFDKSLVAGIESMRSESVLTDLENDEINLYINAFSESCNFYRSRDEQMEILAVETPFSYLLHEDETIRLIMIGKIDLLVNEPGYSNLPYDHKSYERSYPLDRKSAQFCNYAYAMNSNYLMINKVGLQKTLTVEQKHKRLPLSYDPLFLEQWKQNTIAWAYRYLECTQSGIWPLNTTSCNKFNRECEYSEVCNSSGIEAKTYKLEANFNTAEVWDVSKSLGKKEDEKQSLSQVKA